MSGRKHKNTSVGKRMLRSVLPLLLPFLTAGAVTSLDRRIKAGIEASGQEAYPRDIFRHIRLDRVHNDGFAFGRLKDHPFLVLCLPLATSVCILTELLRTTLTKGPLLRRLSLGLLIGGAWSNLDDRLTRGYVTDYLTFNIGPLKKAAVNLGDLAIFAGGLLQIIGSFFAAEDN